MGNELTHILLVDDDDVDAQAIERNLIRCENISRYRLSHRARSLGEAARILAESSIDLILLDLSLPDSSGLATLLSINEMHPETPVIVLTGTDDQALALDTLHHGAQDYLVKGDPEIPLGRAIRYALERHTVIKELDKARMAAASASTAKSLFLANMSHEIRTPLTAIVGFSEIVMGPDLSKERREALEIVHKNAEHLLQIINDILDISKIEAGELKKNMESCSLFEVISELEFGMKLKALEKGIGFAVQYAYPLPTHILTDALRLKQILFNLIGNGIKFTKTGGVKLIVALADNDLLEFKVVDTGIGLTEAEQAKLFKPFSQADATTTREFGGTGLGLAISMQLAEMLEGKISLKSEKGKGSTFTLTVNPGEMAKTGLVHTRPSIPKRGVPSTNTADITLTGKVLIVDDMPDNRDLLSYLVNKAGAKCEVADNGKVALYRAFSETFDLILLDMQMPVMDGYQTARALREQGFKGGIIAVTASAMNSAVHRSIEAGCSDYIRKPFRQRELYCVLEKYLNTGASVEGEGDYHDDVFELIKRDRGLAPVAVGFMQRLAPRLIEMRELWNKKDWPSLTVKAHSLAGAGLFGFGVIGHVASTLESFAISRDHEGTEKALDRMEELGHTIEQLIPEVAVCIEESALSLLPTAVTSKVH